MIKKYIVYIAGFICLAYALYLIEGVLLHKGTRALQFQDYKEALRYIRPLAILGDTTAQQLLGNMYAFGCGVEVNDNEAIKWFKKSEGFQSLQESEYYIAERYKELYNNSNRTNIYDANKSIEWYERSAEGGYDKSIELLIKVYSDGLLGKQPDVEKSEYWRTIAQRKKRHR